MIPTRFRKRQRKRLVQMNSLVSFSTNALRPGVRWRRKTNATEKTPVASIHLKHDFNQQNVSTQTDFNLKHDYNQQNVSTQK